MTKTKTQKIIFPSLLFLVSVFGLSVMEADAASCDLSMLRRPFWGSDGTQQVIISRGDNVTVSVPASDSCGGQSIEFKIYKTDKSTAAGQSLTGNLQKTDKKLNGLWVFKITDTIELDNGDYYARSKIGNSFGDFSLNLLKVGLRQGCTLKKAEAQPKLSTYPAMVNLAVTAEGSCDGAGVAVNVVNEVRSDPYDLGTKQFAAGERVVSFDWKPKENFYSAAAKDSKNEDSYYFIATLGQQKLRSSQFVVNFVGANTDNAFWNPGSSSFNLNVDIFKFKIDNPFVGGTDNIIDLIAVLANFIFQLGVPVAVIIIIYSGILYLVSADRPAMVQKATNGLKYAAIGLAVLLIGKGFVSLVQSILNVN